MKIQNLGIPFGVTRTPQKDSDRVNIKDAMFAAASATWLKEIQKRARDPMYT